MKLRAVLALGLGLVAGTGLPTGAQLPVQHGHAAPLCNAPAGASTPAEHAIVATVKKTNRVLIVHEDTVTGGIAGELTARINELAFEWLDGPIVRVTAPDTPVPYSPPLEDAHLPGADRIVAEITRRLG